MENKEIVRLITTCLNQKINIDPQVNDEGREWWYVHPLYKKDQEEAEMSVEELVEAIDKLKFSSIKEISVGTLMNRQFIQIRGDRLEIIKECLTLQ